MTDEPERKLEIVIPRDDLESDVQMEDAVGSDDDGDAAYEREISVEQWTEYLDERHEEIRAAVMELLTADFIAWRDDQ